MGTMAGQTNWSDLYDSEIRMAEESRIAGNEGRARVCSRRALGIALGEFFRLNNLPDPGPSAIDHVKYFISRNEFPAEQREVASHFILRIDPDHNLPIDADLIAEAKWLTKELLPTLGEDQV